MSAELIRLLPSFGLSGEVERMVRALVNAQTRQLDRDCDAAWELTDPLWRLHLCIIEHSPLAGIPPAVACTWPDPPPHARPLVDVPTGERL